MPESDQDRYQALLNTPNITPEKFVQYTLGIVEADLRVLALLSL